jgi:hypothetical protein
MEHMPFRELTDKMILLYTEGKYADALHLVEQNADQFPEQVARTTFWKMCLLSLSNRPDDVMSVFRQGLDSGLWWAESQFEDSDLNAVRDLPEFKNLMVVSQRKYEAARTRIKRDHTLLVPRAAGIRQISPGHCIAWTQWKQGLKSGELGSRAPKRLAGSVPSIYPAAFPELLLLG